MYSSILRLSRSTRSRRFSSSTPATTPATTASTPSRRLVVSRRLYNARKPEAPKSKEGSTKNKKKNADEKPWPKSIVRASYVAAVTLVPYFGIWFVVSNSSLRERLVSAEHLTKDDSSAVSAAALLRAIRNHFGELDPDSVAYADPDATPDHRFPQELSRPERQRQWAIDQELAANPQQHPVEVFLVEQQRKERLAANTPATVEEMQRRFGTTALSFPSPSPSSSSSSSHEITTTTNRTTNFEHENDVLMSDATASARQEEEPEQPDPLILSAYSYSPWNYFMTSSSSSSGSSSSPEGQTRQQTRQPGANDMEKSRLEYEIQRLENELQQGSNRSVDTILDELNGYKKELRQLTWRKWMPSW